MKRLLNLTIALFTLALVISTTGCTDAENKIQTESKDQLEVYQEELATNKAIVTAFIEAMSGSDTDQLKTMITEDFSWWIIGKPEYLATAGEHDTKYFLEFFKGEALFPEGTNFKATSMIAEGNVVAAEAEFKAKTAMGSDYENYYHFLFIIENGKINRMKEYMDTYHAKTTFGL